MHATTMLHKSLKGEQIKILMTQTRLRHVASVNYLFIKHSTHIHTYMHMHVYSHYTAHLLLFTSTSTYLLYVLVCMPRLLVCTKFVARYNDLVNISLERPANMAAWNCTATIFPLSFFQLQYLLLLCLTYWPSQRAAAVADDELENHTNEADVGENDTKMTALTTNV